MDTIKSKVLRSAMQLLLDRCGEFKMSIASVTIQPKSERNKEVRTLSCGIVPIYIPKTGAEAGKAQYLLLRCYNYWDFPKGGVNLGEEPLQAAIRELHEETTLDVVEFPWGKESRETPVYAQGKVARYFLGQVFTQTVDLPVNPQLGRPEHHEYRWVNSLEARAIVHDRVRAILDWAELTLLQGQS